MMLAHAGLSLVLVCVPIFMPQGGLLGGVGFYMTLLGFLINFPGLLILNRMGNFPSAPALLIPGMILLTELTAFVIPVYIFGMLRKKRLAKAATAAAAATRADAGPSTPEELRRQKEEEGRE